MGDAAGSMRESGAIPGFRGDGMRTEIETISARSDGSVEAGVSRRRAMRTTLASAACLLLPSALDLNGAGTSAQSLEPRSPMTPDPSQPEPAMTFERLVARAEKLAREPHRPAPEDLPSELGKLDYDAYIGIAFRPERTIPLGKRFTLQLFHRGFLQRKRVAITLQPPEGQPRALVYDSSLFDLGPALKDKSFPASLGFAGFRIATAFDAARPEDREEFLVFLGASYFRLRGKGQHYGLSARGVAVNTFGPGTEEFPDFTQFWIDEPAGEGGTVTILALLEGPSLTGAYRFSVTPGDPTDAAVTASLHPRRAIERLGLAPLTSMFLYGQNGPGARGAARFDDYRPQVHDSDGLLVQSPGDRLWRPLVNGRAKTQISAFRTAPLEGFGLLQRERHFGAYLDVWARHEDRPGLWVKPDPSSAVFKAGAVQLFEIPTLEESVDNIVAAFVSDTPVEPGKAISLAYGLTTIGAEPVSRLPDDLARVVGTWIGSAENLRRTNPPSPERRLYNIEFAGKSLPKDPAAKLDITMTASAGSIVDPETEYVPQTGGWRIVAEYRPPNPTPPGDVVLRARLSYGGKVVTETWDAVA